MWFLPLSITLDVKRTRTTWQVRIRVQCSRKRGRAVRLVPTPEINIGDFRSNFKALRPPQARIERARDGTRGALDTPPLVLPSPSAAAAPREPAGSLRPIDVTLEISD
ncbi:hypothetical protein CDO31_36010 (plasmid) [Sinorhizobium meliloti]|nr:hypothetical protein CDO31_36010 [Sinorhizobium meliloti]